MDYRDVAAHTDTWYKSLDERRMVAIAEICWEDDDGNYHEDEEVEVKVIFDVCPTCLGIGHYVNPSIDSHGICADEWANDWSDDEQEMYFSGGYDITCVECDGNRVVPVIDKDHNDKELIERVNNYVNELYYHARERAHERDMGY